MLLRLGLLEIVPGATLDDLDAVISEAVQKLEERELLRLAVIQGDEDGPESGLEAGLLVKELDDLGGLGAPLELHHEPQAVPIRLVTDVGEGVDPPLPGEAPRSAG